MLSPRYRRLWRRRLRRRPLLPFLLAATLAVDLAIWFSGGEFDNPYTGGFIGGQIALLGVWVTHHRRGALARIVVALAVLLLAMQGTFGLPLEPKAETSEIEFEDDSIFSFDFRPIVYVVVSVMAALTSLFAWAVRAVCARGTRTHGLRRPVRLHISSLLWVTLIVVVIISFGRRGAWSILLEAESVLVLLLLEVAPLLVLLPIALLAKGAATRAVWLVAAPCVALLTAMVFRPDGFFAYYATHSAFLGAWLFFATDRGPATEPGPIEQPIEPPPGPIDLHA